MRVLIVILEGPRKAGSVRAIGTGVKDGIIISANSIHVPFECKHRGKTPKTNLTLVLFFLLLNKFTHLYDIIFNYNWKEINEKLTAHSAHS